MRTGARPTERLPLRQLLQLSVYWLGINTIWGGLGVFVQERIPEARRDPARAAPPSRSSGWLILPVVLRSSRRSA